MLKIKSIKTSLIEKLNLPSPIERLCDLNGDITIDVKREDLIHPEFGGNKWRKLKYSLKHYKENDFGSIVSFGGAFSNHIHSLAHIAREYSIPSAGIIRGEFVDPNNPSLLEAKACGMVLHNISKEEYKLKEESKYVQEFLKGYDRPFIIPEGGSNKYAQKGVGELVREIDSTCYDYIFVAAGTGMTASGIIDQLDGKTKTIVINALRNPSLDDVIQSNLFSNNSNWSVQHDYHFGGFAKVPDVLLRFNREFYREYGLLLDPIYNAKTMYAIFDMIERGDIPQGSNILHIHTGGLQGIRGFEYVSKKSWT